MDVAVKYIDIETVGPKVVLHRQDAQELGVNPLDRVEVRNGEQQAVAVVDIHDAIVEPGVIGMPEWMDGFDGSVEIGVAPKPDSVNHIRRKLKDNELSGKQIRDIIQDINENRLNDVELGAYVSAIYSNGMSMDETIHLTEAMVDAGDTLTWNSDIIADKHSIGGVAGNRVTPIVVPIVAAAGIKMPKTSSRAITSPAGTADTMEVFCDVEFTLAEINELVEETNGCMVWGGGVQLSPVDDKIIRAENPLSLDPEGQVIASVLSKKKAAGSTHLVIDIPYGEGSKVEDLTDARSMAHDFKKVGNHLGMTVECTITEGSEPIGNGIGPILEARDVLNVLNGTGPDDLRTKSLLLADILLEMAGCEYKAQDILESGEALESFQEIIAAQNGDPDITADDLVPGEYSETVRATRSGIVTHINNRAISNIARRAGAPKNRGAGILLHTHVREEVEEDQKLFTVYAEQEEKLEAARKLRQRLETIRVRKRHDRLIERA